MKKLIKILSVNQLVEALKIGDANDMKELQRRVRTLIKTRDLAAKAAIKAEKAGDLNLAQQLRQRAEELEQLRKTALVDVEDTDLDLDMDSEQAEDPTELDGNNTDQDEDADDENQAEEPDDTSDDDFDDEDSDEDTSDDDFDDDEAEGTSEDDFDDEEDSDEEDASEDDFDDTSDDDDKDSDEDSDEEQSDKESNKQSDSAQSDEDTSNQDSSNSNNQDTQDSTNTEENSSNQTEDEEEDEEDAEDDDESEGQSDSSDEDQSTSDKQQETQKSQSDTSSTEQDDSNSEDSENTESEDETSEDEVQNGEQGQDAEDDDEELDDYDDSEDPVKDIFQDPRAIPTQGGNGGKMPRDPSLDEIYNQLAALPPKARAGALAALHDLLQEKAGNESISLSNNKYTLVEKYILRESAPRTVRDMSDDEFGDLINSTYDLIDKINPLEYTDDVETRKAKIRGINSPTAQAELNQEIGATANAERHAIKAKEKEAEKYRSFKSLGYFINDFYKAIKDQVETIRVEKQTYDEINNEYEDEDIIMKADVWKEEDAENKPIVNVYFDQSRSWGNKDIQVGQRAIKSIQDFVDRGEVELNLWYFADYVHASPELARRESSTTAWPYIVENIIATHANNVAILTDSDIESQSIRWGEGTTKFAIPGCVWYVWKNGISSPSLPQILQGRQGTFQYEFKA